MIAITVLICLCIFMFSILSEKMDVPVEFIIDCNVERVNSIGESSLIDYFSKTFGVLLRFYPKIDGVTCQVNIRGQHDRLQQLKDAVAYFGRVN